MTKGSATFLAMLILFSALIFASVYPAKADPGANIRIIPTSGGETGEPIVTASPATINIFSTSPSHSPITNIWLTISINKDTYDHLTSITADTTTFTKADFTELTAAKIPPAEPSGTYPGCETGDQYESAAIMSKLGNPPKAYYAYKAFSINTITTAPQTFTVTANAPGTADLKILILANGYGSTGTEGKFNQKTPFSGSTLITPEVPTLVLAASSFIALAVYGIKRRKK